MITCPMCSYGPRLRFSRLIKTIASNNPIPAPKTAPEIVRLRGKYDPLPAARKPTHPITNIQRSMRSRMAHTPITRYGKPRYRKRLNSIAFGTYSDDDNQSEPTGSLELTKSGSMPFTCHSSSIQKRFDVLCGLHISFRLLETTCRNGVGHSLLPSSIPQRRGIGEAALFAQMLFHGCGRRADLLHGFSCPNNLEAF
jgi:hypothetical protein